MANSSVDNSLETWKPVVGWEGLYEVSSAGRVRSLDRILRRRNRSGQWHDRFYPGRILSPATVFGYLRVRLYNGRGGVGVSVHTLVMAAFVGPRPDGHGVNHRNSIRDDNRRENLEYATPKENSQHASALGRMASGERNGNAVLSKSQAEEVVRRVFDGERLQDVAGLVGASRDAVKEISVGNTWKHIPRPPGSRKQYRARGERHHAAALSTEDVRAIIAGLVRRESKASLGRRFGVSDTAICRIDSGKTWSHVTGITRK